jgi:hypothetical protein
LIVLLPDERLRKVVVLAIQCILSCQTPVITAIWTLANSSKCSIFDCIQLKNSRNPILARAQSA